MNDFVRLPDGRLRRKYGGDAAPADPVPAIYDPERQLETLKHDTATPEVAATQTSKKGKE